MNLFLEAIQWLSIGEHWGGPTGIFSKIIEHTLITVFTVTVTAIVFLPLGILIGHYRRGAGTVGAITGAARALPTLGVLTLFGLLLGIGVEAPVLALMILAIPSLLAAAYSGVTNIDPIIPSSAKAIGMSTTQVILSVETPLALPVIVGGIRAATLQVVATATLAAYTSDLGLGRYIFTGLKTRDYAQLIGGALIIIVLALLLEIVLAALQRLSSTKFADPAKDKKSMNDLKVFS